MNIFTKLSLQLQLSLEEYFEQEMIDFDRNVFKIIFLAFRGVIAFLKEVSKMEIHIGND